MQNVTAELANKKSDTQDDRQIGGEMTLDGRYGQIGISAVAAAVRYQGGAKNPAYAPTSNTWRDRIAEAAA
ncbi:MAG TPA: hypothetical protein VMJ52_12920 [Xanthobacteraceae bacterium]|nr:hypothetical protein [Xanthobacteraceae bacterium]